MKKAYIIMAHKNPQQVYRLVSRLNDGLSEFFIHIDKTVDITPFKILEDIGEVVHFIERFNSKWAGLGSVQASLNGLKAIKNTGKIFDRIFLLSGQDYPIKSNAYINSFLENYPKSVFIDYFPIPNHQKWPGTDRGGLYRVDKYYIGLKKYEFILSKAINLISTYIPFLRRKIPYGLKPFSGSAWWSIDSYTLNYVLDHDLNHPKHRAFHRFTFVPDELFMQMVIANSSDEKVLQKLENDNHRLIIWESDSAPHPNTLQVSDFETIRTSKQLFARKFDDQKDTTVLDMIDKEILFKSQFN